MIRFIIRNRDIRKRCMEAVSVITSDVIQEVTIKPHVDSKTIEQRNFWHMLLGNMSDEVGMAPGDLKEIVKAKVMGWRTVSYGGVDLVIADGSSEQLNIKDYSMLIEQTYILAGEAGIKLPPAIHE